MTIAVGILASDGILLAADSEETYNYGKVDGRKIDVAIHWAQDGMRSILLTGSGSAHHIDAFTQFLKADVLRDGRLKRGDPSVVLGEALESFYARHVIPFQHLAGEPASFSLILAYTGDDGISRLFTSQQNSFLASTRPGGVCTGIGEVQARVLLNRFLFDGWTPTLADAAAIAAYVIFCTKETVSGCGKRTDMFALQGHGIHSVIPPDMERLERVVERYSLEFEALAFRAVIGSASAKDLESVFAELREQYAELRSSLPTTQRKVTTSRTQESPRSIARLQKRESSR